jgi:hypothetical protein
VRKLVVGDVGFALYVAPTAEDVAWWGRHGAKAGGLYRVQIMGPLRTRLLRDFYLGTLDSNLVAVDPTGRQVWRSDVDWSTAGPEVRR